MQKRSLRQKREARWGYLFVAPFIIGFVVFMLGPMLFSFIGSFTDYNLTSKMNFIGLGNFRRMFLEDQLFWKSLYNTLYFTIFNVPMTTVFSIFLAVILNKKLKGIRVFRTIFSYRQFYQVLPYTFSGCNCYRLRVVWSTRFSHGSASKDHLGYSIRIGRSPH